MVGMRLKRILFYGLLPFITVMAMLGFPLHVAPRPDLKRQEQSQQVDDER